MKGFSLLELLFTLSIVAIILTLTIPSQKIFLSQSQSEVMSSQLLRAINLTRSEAMQRGESTVLCSSMDKKICSSTWQNDYVIFSHDKKVLYSFHKIKEGILHWRAFPRNIEYVEFLPSGLSHAENGTFWYCPKKAKNPVWAIVMNQSGRIRIVYPDPNGKIYGDKKELLRCLGL